MAFASPWCGFAYVIKKLTNHWFLFPRLRKALVNTLYLPLFTKFAMVKEQKTGQGGLIFFVLEKA